MKVLHLTTHLNTGGITAYIYRLIKPFARMGIETHVVSSGGEWTEKFRSLGALVHELPIKTKSELHPKIYFALPSLLRLINREKIDLLHAHTRITQVMSGWVQRFTGRPYVTTCHGHFKRRLGRCINPSWGECAIAISEPVTEMLQTVYRVPNNRIRQIINGIDIRDLDEDLKSQDPIKNRASYGFSPDHFIVGIISRLIPEKGHQYLAEAFQKLNQRYPKTRLLIVGDGKYRREFESLIRQLQIQDKVYCAGSVTDVAKPLSVIDLFVFPVVWKEGFGLSIAEAMTCGIPVVASKIWALDTIIDHEVNGLLVEPRDTVHLESSMERLMVDAALRKKLAENARRTVESSFSIERVAREIADVYGSAYTSSR